MHDEKHNETACKKRRQWILMQSVSKQNFGEFESTEWSIVYDQSAGLAHYYHRENYEKGYTFAVT